MSRRDDLKFDPMTGNLWEGMPLSPETYRTLYPRRTWLFSPHTGVQRSSESVAENPHMEYVAVPPHRHVPIMTLDECCAAEGATSFPPAPQIMMKDEAHRLGVPVPIVSLDDLRTIPAGTPASDSFLDAAASRFDALVKNHDPVENPKHYTSHPSGVECIQVTEHMGFNLGNAVKYIWRADLKASALEDLKKARWYLDREIAKRGS